MPRRFTPTTSRAGSHTARQLPSGLLRLTPDKGYTLFDGKSHRTFPTADIYPDDLPNWSAVAVDAA